MSSTRSSKPSATPSFAPGAAAEPAPAATVVVLRPGWGRAGSDATEVLLTLRPASMAFAGDMHVFPGGRVDQADADPRLADRSSLTPAEASRALGDNLPPDAARAVHFAAIRELFEEAGVLLADRGGSEGPGSDGWDEGWAGTLASARAGLLAGHLRLLDVATMLDVRLRTDLLAPIAHWTTPPFMPRRFSTWFFVAELPADAEPTFEVDEVVSHQWVRPAVALDQMAAGEISMWVPTSSTLERLATIAAGGPLDAAAVRRVVRFARAVTPSIVEERPSVIRIAQSGAGGVPGRPVVSSLVGRRKLVLVDPGDPSEAAAAAIANAAARRGGLIRAIVLTDGSPDRAGGADGLAIALEIPILVAPGAGRHLPHAVREVSDGERLPSDVPARVRLDPTAPGRLGVVVQEDTDHPPTILDRAASAGE